MLPERLQATGRVTWIFALPEDGLTTAIAGLANCSDSSSPPINGIPSAISEPRVNTSPPFKISGPPVKYLIPP